MTEPSLSERVLSGDPRAVARAIATYGERFIRLLIMDAGYMDGEWLRVLKDRHDIDWAAWRHAGFVFLPEAYVNDVGTDVAPAACVAAARGVFPRADVHPTIGMHIGTRGTVDVATYVDLLARAGTVGFSVYLAETRMTDADWQALGAAIRQRGIAAPAG